MYVRLTDLDELVLSVRDKTSQLYILEAVNAYRGGAYRAAIVSTWIAVVCDIINKILTLAKDGESDAENFKKEFEACFKEDNEDKQKICFQSLEGSILGRAYSFGLIDKIERRDLERLKDDRNPCAHPALVKEEELFQPTPEKVRAHIIHAIIYLLQHPALYGRKVKKRIYNDIDYGRIPKSRKRAFNYFKEEYFASQPKKKLVSELIKELFDKIINPQKDSTVQRRKAGVTYLLLYLKKIAYNTYQETLKTEVQQKMVKFDKKKLLRFFWLRRKGEECWDSIPTIANEKLEEIFGDLIKEEDVHNVFYTYNVFDSIDLMDNNLKNLVIEKFENLDFNEMLQVIKRTLYTEFKDSAIKLLAGVDAPELADEIGEKIILPYAFDFSADQIKDIVDEYKNNRALFMAEKTPEILLKLFHRTSEYFKYTRGNWDSLMRNILKEYQVNGHELEKEYKKLNHQLKEEIEIVKA